MTKQEVKQERKDTDGNPSTRGRMRRLRRALLRKMLAKDVAARHRRDHQPHALRRGH